AAPQKLRAKRVAHSRSPPSSLPIGSRSIYSHATYWLSTDAAEKRNSSTDFADDADFDQEKDEPQEEKQHSEFSCFPPYLSGLSSSKPSASSVVENETADKRG
ncbi:MAG: hypothetical protein WD648_16120, partial [Planctomycetaceae bacterium]